MAHGQPVSSSKPVSKPAVHSRAVLGSRADPKLVKALEAWAPSWGWRHGPVSKVPATTV